MTTSLMMTYVLVSTVIIHVQIHGNFLLQFRFSCEPGGYGLSKDIDVALWLDYRTFQNEPPLPDRHNFVIINSQLHKQFHAFKRDNVRASYSNIPLCSLLVFYCSSKCPHHLSSMVEKYGKVYLELHMSEVDVFVMWVNDMRERYYGVDGERIFENAAQIMSTDKSTGIILVHSGS